MTRSIPALALAALLFSPALPAADAAPKAAGTVVSVSGKVSLVTAKLSSGSLKLGQAVFPGDRIKTGANGRAQLVLADGTQLKVNYLTDITLRDTDAKGKSSERGIASIKIALGDLWAKVTKKNSRLEFETPGAVAAVKGTEPSFHVGENGDLCVKLAEGSLVLTAGMCDAELKANQQVCMGKLAKACEAKISAWDGKQPDWVTSTGPSEAEVTLKVKDKAGALRDVKVRYIK